MAYIIKDGKAIQVVTNDIKIPKNIIDKVDNNKHSKEIIKKAVKSIKKAKVEYAFWIRKVYFFKFDFKTYKSYKWQCVNLAGIGKVKTQRGMKNSYINNLLS